MPWRVVVLMSRERMPQAVVDAVMDRSEGYCEAMIPNTCVGQVHHLHHRKLRSQGGQHTTDCLIGVCSRCHDAVHRHTGWAYEVGLLVHGWDEPRFPPDYYRGVHTPRKEET